MHKEGPSVEDLLLGIYAVAINIRDYQYAILREMNPDKAEVLSELHEQGGFVLGLPALTQQEPDED